MLTRKLPGFEPGSRLTQLSQQAASQLKRVPLPWWQAAVALLLLALLANSAAKLVWALLPQPQTTTYTATLDLQRQSAATSPLAGVEIDNLVALNLFGKAGEVAMAQPVKTVLPEDDIDAEETKLALKLTAVIPSNVQSASKAMIAHSNKQQFYAPGDKLPGGRQVTLDRVFRDRVILNNNGRYESLWLYEENSSPVATSRQTAPVNRVNSRSRAAPRPVTKTPARPRSATVELPQQIPSAESLAQVVKFTIHRRGIQVHPGAERALFDKVGFKPGDVVTHVNGVSVQDPTQAKSLYQQVRESSSASFQILRSGETINLDVDIDNP